MKNILYLFLLPLLFSCNNSNLTFEGQVIDGDVSKIRLAIVDNAKITWLKTIEKSSIAKYKFGVTHTGDKKNYAIFVNDELIPVHQLHTIEGHYQKDIDLSAFHAQEANIIHTYNLDRQFNAINMAYHKNIRVASDKYKEVKKNGSPLKQVLAKQQYESEKQAESDALIEKVTALIKDNLDNELAFKNLSMYHAQISIDDLDYILVNAGPNIKKTYNYQMLKSMFESKQDLQFGKKAPNFSIKTLDGNTIELNNYRGKVVVLDFWASWCTPCIAALPGMKDLYAKYKDKGLEIIAISIDTKASAWEKASDENQLPFINASNLQGNNCPVAKKYGVTAIPHVYLIDQNGVLIADKMTKKELDKKINELLK